MALARLKHILKPLAYVVTAISLLPQAVAQQCQNVEADFRKAIVHIKVERIHKSTGAPEDVEGTGFIFHDIGYLITNDHVVEETDDLKIVSITGSVGSRNGFHTPILVITHDTQHDLALLQLENSSEVYHAIVIGDPWRIHPGSKLCSLGFPLQQEFHYSEGSLGGRAAAKGWWSTSIPSNRGESGAPVFDDATGRVIGVKVGGFDDAQNLNFMIPINLAGTVLALAQVPIQLPSATKPTTLTASTLPSGNTTIYNGFRFYGQSAFKFADQTIQSWGSQEADIGVANAAGGNNLAFLFLSNDAPPYTNPAATSHGIENSGIIQMPTSNLDEVKECPVSDYKIHYFQPQLGNVYCVRTRDGRHWAKIKVNLVAQDRIAFDYVYQPSGSRIF